MKRVMFVIVVMIGVGFALETRVMPREGYGPPNVVKIPYPPAPTATRIDAAPDSRSISGSCGHNICSDTTGNLAVLYGYTSGDPDNIFQAKIGYSTTGGRTWTLLGPFSNRKYRRMYGGIDARPYHWPGNEVIYAGWHEAYYLGGHFIDSSAAYVMFDEGTFPSGSFVRRTMPHSGDPEHNIRLTCVTVAPDDPSRVVFTGGSYNFNLGGCVDIFAWYSTDYGYSWSQPVLISTGGQGTTDPPHVRFGTGGYGFAYINRDTMIGADTLMWPYYMETTNYGQTWTAPKLMQVTPWPPYPQWTMWWYDYDCEVVQNTPFVVMTPQPNPGGHGDRFEFWKGSGPIGNRTWAMTVLAGTTPPGTDSIFTYCQIVTGKDYARGRSVIGAVGYRRPGGLTAGPRLWLSTDMGNSWRFERKLFDVGAYLDPCEISHIPCRAGSYGLRFNGIYFLTNAVYHDSAVIRSGIEEESGENMSTLELNATPNPFVRRATITFSLPRPDEVQIKVYNVAGSRVATLAQGLQLSGQHHLAWSGTDDASRLLPAGTYFIRLKTPAQSLTEKLILTR